MIRVDSARLRQVLTNLIDNALRYTLEGDSIAIQLYQSPGSVCVSIQDTGQGIAPEHLPLLFDRFYRTDASRTRISGGSGLGLAIVKALVEVQGGMIQAQSDGIGLGTTFTISFPALISQHQ